MMIEDINPIFVVGMNRGGTTWLGNLLCSHSKIVTAEHELHWGIKESKILQNYRYWGDLSDEAAYRNFIELFSSSDYFKLVEGNKNYFYENKVSCFYNFFLNMMNQFALKRKSCYWVTKLDPQFFYYPTELERFLSLVSERYTAPKFIGIIREFKGVLESTLALSESRNLFSGPWRNLLIMRRAISETVSYSTYTEKIRVLLSSHNGLLINFEELKSNKMYVTKVIAEYLGINYENSMNEERYPRNSSFHGIKSRVLSPVFSPVIYKVVLPATLNVSWIRNLLLRLRKTSAQPSCPLSWEIANDIETQD